MEKVISKHPGKVCDLTYLVKFACADQDFIRQIIELFFTQVPAELNNLQQQARMNNFTDVKSTAHKLKSSVSLLGAESMAVRLRQVESITVSGADRAQEVLQLHDELLQLYHAAHEELKAYLAGF